MATPSDTKPVSAREHKLAERNAQLEAEVAALRQELGTIRAQLNSFLSNTGKSERWDEGQLPLPISDLHPPAPGSEPDAVSDADPETPASTRGSRGKRKKHPGRKKLSPLLHRNVITIEADQAELDEYFGAGNWAVNGHEVTEALDSKPAQLVVNRYERRRYVSVDGSVSPLVAKADRFLPKAIAEPGLLARIISEKYDMALPLYRQEQAYHREGVEISRSTMVGWLAAAAERLRPIADAIRDEIFAQRVALADETPLVVLDRSAKKGRKQGYIWGYASPQSDVSIDFTTSRGRERPAELLQGLTGTLVVDGYQVYESIQGTHDDLWLASCWAHARRGFWKSKDQDPEASAQFLKTIGALYISERERLKAEGAAHGSVQPRSKQQVELVDHFEGLVDRYRAAFPPQSGLGKAVAYVDARMPALRRFLSDTLIPIDTNALERIMKLVAIDRKNWLFFGSERGGECGAIFMTLVMTCRGRGIDCWAYLKHVMQALTAEPHIDPRRLLPCAYLAEGGARRLEQR